jgi:exodeoxyribonuclease VII small subunit
VARESEKYDEVVQKLEGVVSQLERGELSLEDSLKAFEEGIGLVRRGEVMLSNAEKRIEQLLSEGEERVGPLNIETSAMPGSSPTALKRGSSETPVSASPSRQGSGEEDIPF